MAQGDGSFAGFPYAGGNPAGLGTPVDPDAPANNVEDGIAESLEGRLGCGQPAAFISFRCSHTVCALPTESLTLLRWNRKLNEIADAEAVVNLVGDAVQACCECLGDVEPWCHELHIWRDGKEQFVGPIQQIVYSYEDVHIIAKDVLSWTEVFIPPGDFDYTDQVAFPFGYNLAEIAQDIIEATFANNPFSCEIPHMVVEAESCVSTIDYCGYRFFPAFTGTAFEFLDALASSGVMYTTIGRTVFLAAPRSGQPFNLQRLALLTDEHIMGNLTVTKDGDLMGNRFYVHWDGDLGVPEVSDPVDEYCSGPVERLRDGEGLVTEQDAQDSADAFANAQNIAPRIVNIPTGSRLSPETPVTIDKLIPGATFDVSLTKLCVSVTRSFRLLQVEVTYTPDDGEEITIDMQPVNLPEG